MLRLICFILKDEYLTIDAEVLKAAEVLRRLVICFEVFSTEISQ
jgi:hypothetical protein